jgi:hypothetical protein
VTDDYKLAVGRIAGDESKFVVSIIKNGSMLHASEALDEPELRVILAKKHGQTEAEIEETIARAKSHPPI